MTAADDSLEYFFIVFSDKIMLDISWESSHEISNLIVKIIKVSSAAVLLGTLRVTVQILCIGTDRSRQTVQTKIRLLLKKQSDQGLRCLPFHQHLLDALIQCYIKLFYF